MSVCSRPSPLQYIPSPSHNHATSRRKARNERLSKTLLQKQSHHEKGNKAHPLGCNRKDRPSPNHAHLCYQNGQSLSLIRTSSPQGPLIRFSIPLLLGGLGIWSESLALQRAPTNSRLEATLSDTTRVRFVVLSLPTSSIRHSAGCRVQIVLPKTRNQAIFFSYHTFMTNDHSSYARMHNTTTTATLVMDSDAKAEMETVQ